MRFTIPELHRGQVGVPDEALLGAIDGWLFGEGGAVPPLYGDGEGVGGAYVGREGGADAG